MYSGIELGDGRAPALLWRRIGGGECERGRLLVKKKIEERIFIQNKEIIGEIVGGMVLP